MNNKNKIPAVFKEDLIKLLISLNEVEPIQQGERFCKNCLKVINFDNIQLIIPHSEDVYEYVCNDPICVDGFNHSKENKNG